MRKVLYFLGLLVAQIIVVGLSMGATLLLAFSTPMLLDYFKSPIFYLIFILLIALVSLVVPITSAVWTYRDAKAFSFSGTNPSLWAIIVFGLWLPGFAIYLFLRKFRYKPRLQSQHP